MKSVPSYQRPGYAEETAECPNLGMFPFAIPNGPTVAAMQCTNITTGDAQHVAGHFVMVFMALTLEPDLRHLGFYVAMDPAEARAIGEAIISSAETVEREARP